MASHRQCDLYYAYFHRDPETDIIVYVGVGTLDRAWQVNNRSKEHKEWLVHYCNEGYLLNEIVQLGGSGMPRSMALKHEVELIDEHRPKFNKWRNQGT